MPIRPFKNNLAYFAQTTDQILEIVEQLPTITYYFFHTHNPSKFVGMTLETSINILPFVNAIIPFTFIT